MRGRWRSSWLGLERRDDAQVGVGIRGGEAAAAVVQPPHLDRVRGAEAVAVVRHRGAVPATVVRRGIEAADAEAAGQHARVGVRRGCVIPLVVVVLRHLLGRAVRRGVAVGVLRVGGQVVVRHRRQRHGKAGEVGAHAVGHVVGLLGGERAQVRALVVLHPGDVDAGDAE